ncbi:MAG TPA: CRISPR-associated protein Cas6 [Chloroflexi bacterium]|nr:CRISPR-associated protein Cas6 [Chloroflexota bacterium]HHW87402.1 CRISPR system precrRNA processing endoribonuclease RAMP protein Cas6 [Chloroflexota bacterium]
MPNGANRVMLLSIILELTSQRAGVLPPHLGRAHHSVFLEWVAGFDAPLATALHDFEGVKPFTCSSLLGVTPTPDGLPLRAGETVSVRITSLDAVLSSQLEAHLTESAPTQWNLHNHPFAVTAVICDARRNSWSGSTTCEELAARYLVAGEAPSPTITLEFAAPTAFKSREMHIPLPLPGLVFGSLLDRWNAVSPVQLPDDVRAFAEDTVAVSQYNLRSAAVRHKQNSVLIGGTGTITYRVLGGDRYWLACLNLLADFALYCGVGVKTATGMGQARRMADRRK